MMVHLFECLKTCFVRRVPHTNLTRIILGVDEYGEPQGIRGDVHTFFVGATGSGKGSYLSAYLREYSPFVARGLVQFWGIDLKRGMELGMVENLLAFHAYTTVEAHELVASLLRIAEQRGDDARGVTRMVPITAETPRIYLMIDEASRLKVSGAFKKTSDETLNLLEVLLRIGRAVGIVVVAFSQDPLKESFPLRSLLPQSVALRMTSKEEARLLLGRRAIDLGAMPWLIPQNMAGTAYFYDSEMDKVMCIRAEFMTDDELKRLNDEFGATHEA